MASVYSSGMSTATELPPGPAIPTQRHTTQIKGTNGKLSNGQAIKKVASKKDSSRSYNHVFAIHRNAKVSPFDFDAPELSFFGFKNLMALMLSRKLSSDRKPEADML